MIHYPSLRQQIYAFVRDQLQRGLLAPGDRICLHTLSRHLGVSKTPLRDALIQLETEGFVTILPRRGVEVRRLTLQDIRESYQIVGALEGAVVAEVFDALRAPEILKRLDSLNRAQHDAVTGGAFDRYYQLNLDFHDVFLDLSDNRALKRVLQPLKQRLYDFPRRGYLVEWEMQHLEEHRRFIGHLRDGRREAAVAEIRDVHWGFAHHRKYFTGFYRLEDAACPAGAPAAAGSTLR